MKNKKKENKINFVWNEENTFNNRDWLYHQIFIKKMDTEDIYILCKENGIDLNQQVILNRIQQFGFWNNNESNLTILDVLKKYNHLLTEYIDGPDGLFEKFNKLNNWKSICIEIEIFEHCNHDPDNKLPDYCFYGKLDCRFCPYGKSEVLDEIRKFKIEIEDMGFFVYKNRWWHLSVSKFKSVAKHISNSIPWMNNAGIRGLVFGYSIKEIKDFIFLTGQDEMKMWYK